MDAINDTLHKTRELLSTKKEPVLPIHHDDAMKEPVDVEGELELEVGKSKIFCKHTAAI